MYLDDVTLGGSCSDILHDPRVIKEVDKIGLTLNNSKSEIISPPVDPLSLSYQELK